MKILPLTDIPNTILKIHYKVIEHYVLIILFFRII